MDDGTTALWAWRVVVARVEHDAQTQDQRARVVRVVTDAPGAACCPGRGTRSSSAKAWVSTRHPDWPYGP